MEQLCGTGCELSPRAMSPFVVGYGWLLIVLEGKKRKRSAVENSGQAGLCPTRAGVNELVGP